jgi:hypothetical protein
VKEPIEYRYIRLANGDEIIGPILGLTDTHIGLDYPMIIEERTDLNSGRSALVLSKYMLFGDEDIVAISRSQIIALSRPKPEMISYYHISKDYALKTTEPKIMSEVQRVNDIMTQSITESNLLSQSVEDMDTDSMELALMKPASKAVH